MHAGKTGEEKSEPEERGKRFGPKMPGMLIDLYSLSVFSQTRSFKR